MSLYPYSLLYECYLIRVKPYVLSLQGREENGKLYLINLYDKLKAAGKPEAQIARQIKAAREYIKNYKGKFFYSISLSNPDTYFYLRDAGKFVVFVAP